MGYSKYTEMAKRYVNENPGCNKMILHIIQ